MEDLYCHSALIPTPHDHCVIVVVGSTARCLPSIIACKGIMAESDRLQLGKIYFMIGSFLYFQTERNYSHRSHSNQRSMK